MSNEVVDAILISDDEYSELAVAVETEAVYMTLDGYTPFLNIDPSDPMYWPRIPRPLAEEICGILVGRDADWWVSHGHLCPVCLDFPEYCPDFYGNGTCCRGDLSNERDEIGLLSSEPPNLTPIVEETVGLDSSSSDEEAPSMHFSVSGVPPGESPHLWMEEVHLLAGNRSRYFPTARQLRELHNEDVYWATIDGNTDWNSATYLLASSYSDYEGRLHGLTRLGRFSWPFPVRCSKRYFLTFMRELQAQMATTDDAVIHARKLFVNGLITSWLMERWPNVWGRRYERRVTLEHSPGYDLVDSDNNRADYEQIDYEIERRGLTERSRRFRRLASVFVGTVGGFISSRFESFCATFSVFIPYVFAFFDYLRQLFIALCVHVRDAYLGDRRKFIVEAVFSIACSVFQICHFPGLLGLFVYVCVAILQAKMIERQWIKLVPFVISPITEEVWKHYFGWQYLAVVELWSTIHAVGLTPRNLFLRMIAFSMHYYTSGLPVWMAILFHAVYNYYATLGAFATVGLALVDTVDEIVGLRNVEHFSSIMDILLKLYRKDKKGLLLSAGMNITLLKQALEYLHMRDVEAFVEDFGLEQEEIAVLSGPWYTAFIPSEVHKSPLFKRTLTLVAALVAASARLLPSGFARLSDLINWDYIPDSSFLDIAVHGVKAVYEAINRVASEGFSALWDLPGDVYFIDEATKLLYEDCPMDNVDDVAAKYERAQDLLYTRKFRVGDASINRLVDRLRAYSLEKTVFLRENKRRSPPAVVFLGGDPGVGKTTLIEAFINMISVANGWTRFLGDTVDYNIQLKFPAETGLHSKARFLVINDIPDDYTNFDMVDKIPLDVLIQQVCDTCKFEIRSAAVEKKGMVLNDLQIVIITSNFSSFVFPNKCEKLARRIDTGAAFWISFKDPKNPNRHVAYEDVCRLSDIERIRYVTCLQQDVVCKDKRMVFVASKVNYTAVTYPEMIRRVMKGCIAHRAIREAYDRKFVSSTNMCACGSAEIFHLGPDGYERLTPACDLASVVELEQAVALLGPSGPATYDPPLNRPAPRIPVEPGDEFNIRNERYHEMATARGPRRSRVLDAPSWLSWIKDGFMVCLTEFSAFVYVLLPEFVVSFFCSLYCYLLSFRIVKRLVGFSPQRVQMYVQALHAWCRLKAFIVEHKIAIAIIGVLSVGAIVKAFFGKKAVETLGKPIFSKDVDPDSMRVNVVKREVNFSPAVARTWAKKEGSITTIEVKTVGVHVDDLRRMCMAQTFDAVLYSDEEPLDIKIFAISPEMVLINRHFLRKVTDKFTIMCNGFENVFLKSDVRYGTEKCEMVGLVNWFAPYVAPLHKFLAEEVGGAMMIENLATGVSSVGTFEKWVCPTPMQVFDGVAWPNDPNCVEGMCATPVLACTRNDWFIVGCVAYRRKPTKQVGCTVVLQKDYEAMCKDVDCPIDSCVVSLLGYGPVGELSQKAELRNVCSPNMLAVGTLKKGSSTFHSKFKRSRFYNDVIAKDILSKPYGIPLKIAGVVDGEYKSAFLHQFSSVDEPDSSCDSEWFAAIDDYLEPFKNTDVRLRPMTLEEAIFGCPEMDIDRVDFKTSVGFAMKQLGCRNKYDLFVDNKDGTYRLRSDFREKVVKNIDLWKSSSFEPFTVELSPKDEIRPLDKLDVFKLRLFSVLDFDKNAAMRMYVMPLIRFLLDLPELSECYGAMNAGGVQWTKLALRLKRFNHYIDMDFKNYDTRHKRAISMFARLMRRLALIVGYTGEEADIVYTCVFALRVQICIYMNDVFFKLKGMPSGVIVTLILNSVVNSLLMRIAFKRLCPGLHFRDEVNPATVGDDNASSVSGKAFERFNMMTIEAEYKTLGYEVTGASKGKITKEIPFENLVFIKRHFVWDSHLSRYLAPLEWDSVIKPLCFEKVDIGTTSEQRLVDVASMGQREAWLHGKERFAEYQSLIIELFSRHRMSHVLKLHTYETLEKEFLDDGFTTFAC